MGKKERDRWSGNLKSMEIVNKPLSEITYEEKQFLKENYTSRGGLLDKDKALGAFFTPSVVCEAIWKIMKHYLPENAKVLEPSCGSGVFIEHASEEYELTGLELDETSAKIASVIYENAEIIQGDAFLHKRRNYYDAVIGNPPYGLSLSIEDDGEEWASAGKPKKGEYKSKSEVLFIELALKVVKVGGYVAFVLPMGINYASYAAKLRKLMHETAWQIATVELPAATFAATGTKIKTQIMIIRKAPPNTKLIEPATKKWGSNFRRGGYEDITSYEAKFLEGQIGSYFGVITDIGWDEQLKPTENADGLQLEEMVDDLTSTLMRENLYPHIPSWHSLKDCESFFFQHANGSCDGIREARACFHGYLRWNELTLGTGDEIEWNDEEWSTYDFDWQDAIVDKWYQDQRRFIYD